MIPISFFTQPDPHAVDNPQLSPYAYCGGNPIMAIDPTGCDSIYMIENEILSAIGFMDDDNRYLVNKKMAGKIKEAISKGESLPELRNDKTTAILPSNDDMRIVLESVEEANNSGKETGGHKDSSKGIVRWDNGNGISKENRGVVNSIIPFMVNGKIRVEKISNIDYYWHVHPIVDSWSTAGKSKPSPNDYGYDKKLRKDNYYEGAAFVIGGKDGNITFYHNHNTIVSLKLQTLLNHLKK